MKRLTVEEIREIESILEDESMKATIKAYSLYNLYYDRNIDMQMMYTDRKALLLNIRHEKSFL